MLLSFVVAGLLAASACGHERPYVGYKVLEIVPNTDANSRLLRDWELNRIELDFWSNKVGQPATVMVPPKSLDFVLEQAAEFGMDVKVIKEDVQMDIDLEFVRLAKNAKAYNPNDFNTLADIESEINNLANSCPSDFLCSVRNLGNSYEGRPIRMLTISKSGSNRRGIWIDSTIHAREWLAPTTNMRVMDYMIKNYRTDSNVRRMIDNYDWYFVPMMNPDGYEYTWTNDRLWRKNRRPDISTGCIGTDLNRNYNFRWGLQGVSTNPCSNLFCGRSGGSEPETQVIQNELKRLNTTLVAMVTIHSYGNMFMHPWGNTINFNPFTRCERADDHNAMYAVADATANAIQRTYNTRWARGTSCEVIYETTGGTDDYAKGKCGIQYSFCPELRGSDFVVPRSQIQLSFQEFFNGMVAMADALPR